MKRVLDFFTLFTAFSTLTCCALPAMLITLGMGAAMAGFLSNHPELIWLSENKIWLFTVGGFFLVLGGLAQYRNRNEVCPIESKKDACSNTRKSSKVIYLIGLGIYLIGFSFAYIIPFFM